MKFKEKMKNMNKKTVAKIVGIFVFGWIVGMASTPVCSDTDHVGLEETVATQETQIETLNAKVAQAKPFFEMKDEEKQKLAEEQRLAQEKKKQEEEQKQKELEEQKLAEERKGYDTDTTYDQLARTPDDYMLGKVKFNGKVVQVMEGDGKTQIRLAVNGDYDKMLLAEYTPDKVKGRVLEEDNITVRGLSMGLISYESTMGGNITIPSVAVVSIEQ